MTRPQPILLFTVLSLLLLIAVLLALASGAVTISLQELMSSLWFFGQEYSLATDYKQTIITDLRLPRVLLAAMIGCILAISGAVMQGLFRNPLADPSLIGVSAGASLGASIAIVMTVSLDQWLGLSVVSIGAFLGGVLAVMLVFHLANHHRDTRVATMLLAGIAISALAGSVNGLLEFYSNNMMLRRISLWRMGGFEGVSNFGLLLAALTTLLLLCVLPRHSQALNAMLLRESEARHLGINTEKLKRHLIILVAIGVGIAVALSGTIAFIGLVVPHLIRLLMGPDHRILLPASALAGAILLVVADNISRTLLAPTELPVGIITAFVGVPFFLSLLQRSHIYRP